MDELLELTNIYVVDPVFFPGFTASAERGPDPWSKDYSRLRQFLVLWTFLYLSSLIVYIIFASSTFLAFYVRKRRENLDPSRKEHHVVMGRTSEHTVNVAYWPWDTKQIREEIWVSTWSLCIMSGLVACADMVLLVGGLAKLYNNISDYGYVYFALSPLLFLVFTDTLIYWIHRALHWPSLYWLHKLHHHYKETTPFSAFSFHPLDGFAQSLPYHLFPLFFPMHKYLYTVTLMMVGLWTINIHDRMTLRIPGVNGAAHHTIHHTKFNYNYGQYFTFWDRFFDTYKDPLSEWPYELDEQRLEKERIKEMEMKRAGKVAPIPDEEPSENKKVQ